MMELTDQQIENQIDQAIANQSKINETEPKANKVLFNQGTITIYFINGSLFSFSPKSVDAIANLSPNILATVELTPSGKGLRWDQVDIDLSIQGLLLGKFGSKKKSHEHQSLLK
ncbi:MAG TPA: DUF2442 domain-containing protein [Cyanothece sp. UBA12306]|nr:DUF2442 domain-containing protein [Cyanothece sp. UBA12306]